MKTLWAVSKGDRKYLGSSDMVDLKEPIIEETTLKVIKDCKTKKETAIKLFYYVRDQIPYGLIGLYPKASEVLKGKKGQCMGKSAAFVAMLRTANIPSRFHFAVLDISVLRDLIGWPYLLMPKTIDFHAWVEVKLNGKWVNIDANVDKKLIRGINKNHINYCRCHKCAFVNDWHGKKDTYSIQYKYLLKDLGSHINPENVIEEGVRKISFWKILIEPIGWWAANKKLEKIRKS